ncbi:unnamed protein product [Auanema sp. JU1783]|nr:unnamed protein product [Auanema sp. JU1783]
MEKLENVSFVKEFESRFMKPVEFSFVEDGKERKFDLALAHSSVITLLYHKTFRKFLVVRQFRPAVFVGRICKYPENLGKKLEDIQWENYSTEIGYTLELCGGLVDKDLPLVDIAREEVEEECGYKVPTSNFQLLGTYSIDADESGSIQSLYYAEIDETMKISGGGGNEEEGEVITNVFLTEEEAHQYVKNQDSHGPPGVFFSFLWWFQNEKIYQKKEPSFIWKPEVQQRIGNFKFTKNQKSNRYHPIRMCFTLNQKKRFWDLAPCEDSVAALVFNTDTNSFLYTQRFRPAVVIGRTLLKRENENKELAEIDWTSHDPKLAYTLEMCSTHVLTHENNEAKVMEAIEKKLGFRSNKVQYVTSFAMGISQSGDRQRIYFVEVSNADKIENFTNFEDILPVIVADDGR